LNHKEVRGLLSDEHFSVDGTQVAAWASMKSFRAKDGRTSRLRTAATVNVISTARRAAMIRMLRQQTPTPTR
jgi:hypothetical protein